MSERFDLQKILLEMQDDKVISTEKTTHLSQDQIKDLMTRRKARNMEQNHSPAVVL